MVPTVFSMLSFCRYAAVHIKVTLFKKEKKLLQRHYMHYMEIFRYQSKGQMFTPNFMKFKHLVEMLKSWKGTWARVSRKKRTERVCSFIYYFNKKLYLFVWVLFCWFLFWFIGHFHDNKNQCVSVAYSEIYTCLCIKLISIQVKSFKIYYFAWFISRMLHVISIDDLIEITYIQTYTHLRV